MKKFLAVMFMLLVTVYFAVPVMANEPVKEPVKEVKEAKAAKKGAFESIELTGKFVKDGKKDLFVAENGQKYFILKSKKFEEIVKIADYANKTFKIKGTTKPLTDKQKAKKDFFPGVKIEEFTEAGAAAPAEAPKVEAPKTEAAPVPAEAPKVEAPKTEAAPAPAEAPKVEAPKTEAAPAPAEAPKAEEKPAESGK